VEITNPRPFATRQEWRDWLRDNHATETELWMVYYKKGSGKPTVTYDEAVEEALCYGWIDGLTKSIDAERYAQRFTPRKPKSNWSEPNKRRVKKLIEQGRMTKAGMAKITFPLEELDALDEPPSQAKAVRSTEPDLPDYVRDGLMSDPQAWENFNKLAPSYRRDYVKWIMAPKGEEARERRLREALELLAQNKKLGLK
jgi:uncharacterized protein YdeI (YjbR/CyaY-like superfamily)